MTGYIYDKIVREKDGKKLNITIQQVTRDLVEGAVDHMTDNFLKREPLCTRTKASDDPVSVQSFRILWTHAFESGAAIVALLDEDGESRPKIIGANATCISKKNDAPLPKLPGEAFNVILGIVLQITQEADIWTRYNVDSYLTAFGLSVHQKYSGLGLGSAIVDAREKVCKIYNVPMTETVFTAPASQRIAEKAAFETVVEHTYKQYDYKLSDIFRVLDGKISVMVKRYN